MVMFLSCRRFFKELSLLTHMLKLSGSESISGRKGSLVTYLFPLKYISFSNSLIILSSSAVLSDSTVQNLLNSFLKMSSSLTNLSVPHLIVCTSKQEKLFSTESLIGPLNTHPNTVSDATGPPFPFTSLPVKKLK